MARLQRDSDVGELDTHLHHSGVRDSGGVHHQAGGSAIFSTTLEPPIARVRARQYVRHTDLDAGFNGLSGNQLDSL